MKSLRLRFTLWFSLSLFVVVGVFMVVTHYHLEYELRKETRERQLPGNENWNLHGAYSEAEVHDIIRELWRSTLLYSGPALLVSLGLGFLLARRAFAPVAEMRRQLHAITARNLTQRIRISDADEEFQAIESAINALLTRLETTFAQLSEYSAQVAHEIRTPLTLLRLQIEDSVGRIEPVLAESLQEELAQLSEYAEQCLLLATAEQGRLKRSLETVELRRFTADLLDNFTLLARSEGREIVFNAPDSVSVQVDPQHLRQMLHNLLTNAIQHGAGTIVVTLAAIGRVRLQVDNAIAGATLRRHRSSGLGLRIVRALAATEGLEFKVEHQPGSHYGAALSFPKCSPCT